MGGEVISGRQLLKANWELLDSGYTSDQAKGLPPPPLEKAAPEGAAIVALPGIESLPRKGGGILDLLLERKSRRKYGEEVLGLEDLACLCWSAEGVKVRKERFTLRTAPSGGARHAFELYVYVSRVKGLEQGLYRYLPLEHSLCLLKAGDSSMELDNALMGQYWNAACVFVWTALPYRCEWRYGPVSPKLILLDAGHACQNLYLACESLGLGTCAIGAYDQAALNRYLDIDGEEEMAIYAAPVGKPAQ